MIHYLKTWPEHFEAVHQERKTFEIRENDRHFRVGDWLQLYEWCPKSKDYTGRVILTRVTYITDFEQKPGFVVMAIAPPGSVVERCVPIEGCAEQLPEVKTSTQIMANAKRSDD